MDLPVTTWPCLQLLPHPSQPSTFLSIDPNLAGCGVVKTRNSDKWLGNCQHEMDSQFRLFPPVPSSKLKGNVVVIQWKWKSWWWPCSQLFQHPPPGPSYELLHGLLSKQQRVTNIQHHGEDVQITGPPSGWADTKGANETSRKSIYESEELMLLISSLKRRIPS